MPSPHRCRATLFLIVAAMHAWLPLVAAASPATPEPDTAIDCDVPPRSRDDIATLLETPFIATPSATTGGRTLPEGIPVSAETSDAVAQIVRKWLACQNAGEQLRAWALFSDGYLYRLLARQGSPTNIDSFASPPVGGKDGGAKMLEIGGERQLPDGRLGATVVIAYPAVPMPKTFFFSFTEVDGRLLIDGILGEISFAVP